MMNKLILIGMLLCFFSVAVCAEKTLKPYQDYLIILVHGLNDNRTSFVGENEAQSAEVRKARNMQDWISKSLGIPEGYIRAYSYAQSRGSNLENSKLLGLSGYMPETIESERPSFDKAREKGGDLARPIVDVVDGAYNAMIQTPYRQLMGDSQAIIRMTDHKVLNEQRLEYWSYDPALDKYIPTNIEPGHTILDQAKKDFKQWYFESDLNYVILPNGNKDKIVKDPLDPRLEAIVPKKVILMPHSMGNLSTRLYIYSNELAAEGKFFDKGFYKGDVEKVVFINPPLKGSDMAWVLVYGEATLV